MLGVLHLAPDGNNEDKMWQKMANTMAAAAAEWDCARLFSGN